MRDNGEIKCRHEGRRSGYGSGKPARLPEAAASSTATSVASAATAPTGATACMLVEGLRPKAKAPPSHFAGVDDTLLLGDGSAEGKGAAARAAWPDLALQTSAPYSDLWGGVEAFRKGAARR